MKFDISTKTTGPDSIDSASAIIQVRLSRTASRSSFTNTVQAAVIRRVCCDVAGRRACIGAARRLNPVCCYASGSNAPEGAARSSAMSLRLASGLHAATARRTERVPCRSAATIRARDGPARGRPVPAASRPGFALRSGRRAHAPGAGRGSKGAVVSLTNASSRLSQRAALRSSSLVPWASVRPCATITMTVRQRLDLLHDVRREYDALAAAALVDRAGGAARGSTSHRGRWSVRRGQDAADRGSARAPAPPSSARRTRSLQRGGRADRPCRAASTSPPAALTQSAGVTPRRLA